MKNVTISMDEDMLRWVRVEAAKAGLSVSRWVADRLQTLNQDGMAKAAAAARIVEYLEAGPYFDLSVDGKITIDRDEIYDGGRFRRFDHDPLRPGSAVSSEAGAFDEVAEEPVTFRPARDQSAGSE
jgi:hypothetical protein